MATHNLEAGERAAARYVPRSGPCIEQDIELKAHSRQDISVFLTLRDVEGTGLATAMLPRRNQTDPAFRPVIVGYGNRGPCLMHHSLLRWSSWRTLSV